MEYSLTEIENMAALGCQINIDNLWILKQFGTKHPEVPICICITPHVLIFVKNIGMKINRIHTYTGSDILNLDVFLYASEISFKTTLQFSDFKAPYKETNIDDLLQHQIIIDLEQEPVLEKLN